MIKGMSKNLWSYLKTIIESLWPLSCGREDAWPVLLGVFLWKLYQALLACIVQKTTMIIVIIAYIQRVLAICSALCMHFLMGSSPHTCVVSTTISVSQVRKQAQRGRDTCPKSHSYEILSLNSNDVFLTSDLLFTLETFWSCTIH